jgi:hypothetical protein
MTTTKREIPPIAGEADTERESRLDAERVTWEFRSARAPQRPQKAVEDLPLFGGERQKEMF